MTGTFYLKCMGLPELRAPNGRVVRMRGRKHLALLIFLAVERRTQYARDELAHLLWAGAPMAEARHSLATAASAIRRALGPAALEGNREVLRLRHTLVRLDLDRLESGELFPTPELPAIEVDTFLHGFDIRDSQEYTLWQDRQHAQWLPAIHAALLRLIDHGRRTGASRVIGTLADRLLTIDPLSEDGIRAKMEALAFAGDRIAALRVFEEWRDRLQVELEAAPSPLVEEMARRLRRRGLERPVGDSAPSVQTDPWRDRPFVGRAAEYRQLYESWESAVRQSPRHVLVEGESGIGKSTLVERFSTAAALEGASVTRAQCYELERAIPFAAVATLVAGLVDKPGASSTDPAALAEVARVVPRVRERFPGLPAPRESQGETARLHFAEGVLALLEAVMEEHPVVMVVDDFHLADEASLTVLHLLIRRLEGVRLIVLLTMRTSELQASSGAARIHGGGEYLRMSHLRLPPLSEAESSELLSGLVPKDHDPPTPSERHILLHAARGVPMVLQLLVQDWLRHGSESLALSVRSMTERPDPDRFAPAEGAYRNLVERILGELSPTTTLVLQASTVLGSRIGDLQLYQVADLTTSQVMIGMTELTQRHILRDSSSGMDFTNELVRGHAYAQIPSTLRQSLHSAVASRLIARLVAGEESPRGLETAWHLVRGGRKSEAAPHLLQGAHDAICSGAPHEAELALGTALAASGVLSGASRVQALLLHAEISQELSLWRRSLTILGTIPDQIAAHHIEQRDYLTIVARHHTGENHPTSTEAALGVLLRLSAQSGSTALRARAVAAAARIAEECQALTHVEALWQALTPIECASTNAEELAHVMITKATLHYSTRNLAACIAAANEGLELLKEAGYYNTTYVNLVNSLSAAHCAVGEYEQAEALAREAHRLAWRLDNLYLARKASVNISVSAGRQGRYREQEEWGRRTVDIARGSEDYALYIRAATYVGEARAMQNEGDALDRYHDILARAPATNSDWSAQALLLNEADIHLLMGKASRALEYGRRGTTGAYSRILNRGWTGKFARWVTLAALDSGRLEDARDLLNQLMREITRQDAIDRVEIASCYLLLHGQWSAQQHTVREQALTWLAQLPPTVCDWLERLRVLGPIVDGQFRGHPA